MKVKSPNCELSGTTSRQGAFMGHTCFKADVGIWSRAADSSEQYAFEWLQGIEKHQDNIDAEGDVMSFLIDAHLPVEL